MPNLRFLLATIPFAALCACATTPGAVAVTGGTAIAPRPAPSTQNTPDLGAGDSPYGLFLAGQAAVNSGHGDTAAAYFDRAAALDSGSEAALLGSHSFSALLLSGDVTRAAAVAPTDDGVDVNLRRLGALTRGVEALSDGNARRAYAILTGPDVGAPYNGIARLLAPWAAAAAGDLRGASVHPVIDNDPVAQFYANLDQGRIFEHFRHYDEAETAFRSLISSGDPGGIASLNLGQFLERRGRAAEAAEIYAQALARNASDQGIAAARARALAHGRPPALPTIRQSAAEALVGPSTVLIIQKQQQEVALAFLRLTLRLDPSQDVAWVLVGDILANIGDEEGARMAYQAPRPGSREFLSARAKLAWSYQSGGDKAAALKIARTAYETSPTDQEAATTLADLLRADNRFDESVKVLAPLIQGQGNHPDWRLLYMRAVDLQESDHWADAERDLTLALSEAPDEPELLNFLGYSWIDRGENLPRALAMVKKAVSLNPQSGAMIDSLGWAYYRLGDYSNAVDQLEAAVVLEAGDPEINDHLGDAYWRIGRQTEARFQWRRVLSLEPNDKLKGIVEEKLKSGLTAAPPAKLAGS